MSYHTFKASGQQFEVRTQTASAFPFFTSTIHLLIRFIAGTRWFDPLGMVHMVWSSLLWTERVGKKLRLRKFREPSRIPLMLSEFCEKLSWWKIFPTKMYGHLALGDWRATVRYRDFLYRLFAFWTSFLLPRPRKTSRTFTSSRYDKSASAQN